MLTAEKDIESFIMMRRLTVLLSKVLLKPHQLQSIHYFRKYVMHDKAKTNSRKNMQERVLFFTSEMAADELWNSLAADQIWSSLDLQGNAIDRLILHEITRL